MPELQHRNDLKTDPITTIFRYNYFHKFPGMELIAGGAYFDNKQNSPERRTHQGVAFSTSRFEQRVLLEQRDFSGKTLFQRMRWRINYNTPVRSMILNFYNEIFYTFNGEAFSELRIGLLLAKKWDDYLFTGGYSLFPVKGENNRDVFLLSLRRDF
jgi:hypothetical protein